MICGLLAVMCWLVVSMVPPGVAGHERDSKVSELSVRSLQHGLDCEGLRPETASAKTTLDHGKPGPVVWATPFDLQAAGSLCLFMQKPVITAAPVSSLLTLGICLRL